MRTGFPRRTGLYTSPHLVNITERIRIDFVPLSKDLFAQNFFEVYDGLRLQPNDPGPRYLQLLACISYHTFLKAQVDVAIYETHHGGEYDATNVVQNPIVTGITSIGMDHVATLGPTIENIAWHKAGILKTGAPAFSAPQESSVANVLKCRAAEKRVMLEFVEPNNDLPGTFTAKIQVLNATIAHRISNAFLNLKHPKANSCLSSEDTANGIQRFKWPGRFHLIQRGRYYWYLDGAHNELSIAEATSWFDSAHQSRCVRIYLITTVFYVLTSPSVNMPPESLFLLKKKPSETALQSSTGLQRLLMRLFNMLYSLPTHKPLLVRHIPKIWPV